MFALPLFLWADTSTGAFAAFLSFAAWCFAIGGIILGYYAAMKYIPAARAALRDGRTSSATTSEVRT
jgi:hypothetical protein